VGEQQRVAIARALATNVKLILADEPTGNLDTDTEREIISIFKNLAHDYQCCVIVVSHSQEVTKESDVSLRLTNGKLVEIKGEKHE
jgi:putative ABC transport system ATP-binding protein